MIRALLIGLGAIWCATGVYIFAAPEAFYENTPGLSIMGPFSVHFIRDVGLAFLASGPRLATVPGAACGASRLRARRGRFCTRCFISTVGPIAVFRSMRSLHSMWRR
jgi:hypothetical protein